MAILEDGHSSIIGGLSTLWTPSSIRPPCLSQVLSHPKIWVLALLCSCCQLPLRQGPDPLPFGTLPSMLMSSLCPHHVVKGPLFSCIWDSLWCAADPGRQHLCLWEYSPWPGLRAGSILDLVPINNRPRVRSCVDLLGQAPPGSGMGGTCRQVSQIIDSLFRGRVGEHRQG